LKVSNATKMSIHFWTWGKNWWNWKHISYRFV